MNFEIEVRDLPFVNFSSLNNLPNCSGIYFVIDSNDICHYIGQAEDLQKRWKNHHRKFQIEKINQKYPVKIFWLIWSKEDLTTAEKYFIDFHKPLLNTTKVETPQIIPSEIILKQLLRKIARKVVAIGIVKGGQSKLTTIYLKYDARDYTSRGAASIIKQFQIDNKLTTLKIKRTKYVKTIGGIFYSIGSREQKQAAKENRAFNNHWQIFCNGVVIDITPEIGINEHNFLFQKSVQWRLASIKTRAIVEPNFTEMLKHNNSIVQGLPPLSALDSKKDPIPLLWKDWEKDL